MASVTPCFHGMKKLPIFPALVWSIPLPFVPCVTAQMLEEGRVNQGKQANASLLHCNRAWNFIILASDADAITKHVAQVSPTNLVR
mmetsp:Transcript_99111/g.196444  ORF Transcript_99111/g.196444 Transcript_99111/m.196444 type:complete len:86 (+) Transcript_99111:29-286(+)